MGAEANGFIFGRQFLEVGYAFVLYKERDKELSYSTDMGRGTFFGFGHVGLANSFLNNCVGFFFPKYKYA